MGVVTDGGGVITNEAAAIKILDSHPGIKDKIWYDYFLRDIVINIGPGEARSIEDRDYINLLVFLQGCANMKAHKFKISHVKNAIKSIIGEKHRSVAKDFMDKCHKNWDSECRISSFFIEHCNAEGDELYLAELARNFFVGIVARIYCTSGAKVDSMLVIEGEQGAGKSSLAEVLSNGWHNSAQSRADSKDFLQETGGSMIVEIDELHSFKRVPPESIKKIITCATDKYRVPYADKPQPFPRQFVFVGTTNNSEYLDDPTGARRYWPLKCGEIDTETIKNIVPQLYGEAVTLFKQGVKWWEFSGPSQKVLKDQHSEKFITDPWDKELEKYLVGKEYVIIEEFLLSLQSAGYEEVFKLTKSHECRVARMLRHRGLQRQRKRMPDGSRPSIWPMASDSS